MDPSIEEVIPTRRWIPLIHSFCLGPIFEDTLPAKKIDPLEKFQPR